ncbi:hypothetical protein BH695_2173 [Microcystis aeruginosa PCC 7806SL]|uniref:Uncharacterized protein n=1 Tax=Microcystis aeruginosa PCC 7806SL TaxID=1903187 RepID=A0AB33BLW0_MICA7|nr:hypothetical protein BH695_2173 [Microcystis aeruginosa PCC 7806SL]
MILAGDIIFYKIGELIHKRTNLQTEGGKPITPRYDSRSI